MCVSAKIVIADKNADKNMELLEIFWNHRKENLTQNTLQKGVK